MRPCPRLFLAWARRALVTAMLLCPIAGLLAGCGQRPIIPAGTTLYLAGEAEHLHAIDANTGGQLWQTPALGGSLAAPIYAPRAHLLYAAAYHDATGSALYALDPATVAQRWSAQVDPRPSPAYLQLVDGVFYLVIRSYLTHDSTLYALREDDHTVLWKRAFAGFIYQRPLVTGGRIYIPWNVSDVPSPTGALIALRAADGAQLWRAPLPGDPYSSPVTISDDVILSVDGGWVMALRQGSGEIAWRYQPPNYRVGLSNVDAAGGLVYVAAGRTFYAMHADTGAPSWRFTVAGSPDRNHQQYYPAVAHGILYALAVNDTIAYAIRPETGQTLWHFDDLGYSRSAAPAVSGGVAYVATGWGGAVALSEADGTLIRRYDARVFADGVTVVAA